MRHHVPHELEVELHDGSAWLGIVPFRMSARAGARRRCRVPGASSFLELNVRTYVRTADEKPGVWFFSLDASSRLAVQAARRSYRLPYFHARMALDRHDGWIDVECTRLGERGKVFSGRYRAGGDVFHAEPGSLEWFLDRALLPLHERRLPGRSTAPRSTTTSGRCSRRRPRSS